MVAEPIDVDVADVGLIVPAVEAEAITAPPAELELETFAKPFPAFPVEAVELAHK